MKLQPLYDLQQDINRLFIAGSKFAKGDPRLQKHIAIFTKLGEKAPVFKKIATDLEALFGADTQSSPEKLMNISTLLYSVLYTQGELTEPETGIKEQTPEIPLSEVNTAFTYLQLKPVIDALTTSNPGRLELLKDAFAQGVFKDSRTYGYLDLALGDKYGELSYYIEFTIIPSIGKPVIPFLLRGFTYEDKTDNARRLRSLKALGYAGVGAMIETILGSSLPTLRAEAVTMLAEDTRNEALVIQLADDKNKLVRAAAYKALAKLDTRPSLEKLTEVYLKSSKNKSNLELVTKALASTKLPFFFQEVFHQVVDSFESVLTLDKTTDDKVLVNTIEKFNINLVALKNKDRQDVLYFVLRVATTQQLFTLLAAKETLLMYPTNELIYNLSDIMLFFTDIDKSLTFFEKNMASIPSGKLARILWRNYFALAMRKYTPEKMYDTFAPQLMGSHAIGMDQLWGLYGGKAYSQYDRFSQLGGKKITTDPQKVDPRWYRLLYSHVHDAAQKWSNEYDSALVLLSAIEPQNNELDQLMVWLTERIAPKDRITIFGLLVLRGAGESYEIVFRTAEKMLRTPHWNPLMRLCDEGFWGHFPKAYAERFRNLDKNNKMDLVKQIAEEIDAQ